MSRLRCLVWKSFSPCGERLRSRRSGIFVSSSNSFVHLPRSYSSRSLLVMDLSRIIAFYVSMALSYLVIPTTAMISFFQRTLMRRFSSRSINSGYWLDSILSLLSPSPSSIRYRKVSFDTSVFSDWRNWISQWWRSSRMMLQMRKSAIRTKWRSCDF